MACLAIGAGAVGLVKTRNPYARPARGSDVLKFAVARPRFYRAHRLLLLAGALAVGCALGLGVAFLIARHYGT